MGPDAGPNAAQADYWESRAGTWIATEDLTVSVVGGAFGDAAIERLAPRPGERVLDIGCGTGPTTSQIARRVQPGGSVLGLDISPTMVATATERAAAAGLDDVTFAVADVQSTDLGDGSFDAAFSRFGVMFFTDPTTAFANVGRSLRSGGRLTFACWQDLDRNEWMFVPGAAAVAVSGVAPNMPEPGAPGPFSLCDPDRIRSVLGDAGFSDVQVQDEARDVVVPEERIDDVVRGASAMGAVREQLALFPDDPGMQERIVAGVRAELARRLDGGVVRFTSAAWIVSASV